MALGDSSLLLCIIQTQVAERGLSHFKGTAVVEGRGHIYPIRILTRSDKAGFERTDELAEIMC